MSDAPLLNYTTEVPASRSMGEVTGLLVEGGARAVMTEYDEGGNVTAFNFAVETPFGMRTFRLPVNVDPVLATLHRMHAESHPQSSIRKRGKADRAQAERVAWRIIKDWLEAQLALIRLEMVGLDQVMLPYMRTESGETVYEIMVARQLALPEKVAK